MIDGKLRRVFSNGEPLISVRMPSDGTRYGQRLFPIIPISPAPLNLYTDLITATAVTSPANVIPTQGFLMPPGQGIAYTAATSDGCVFLPLAPQSGNGSAVPGVLQQCIVLYPSGEADLLTCTSIAGLNPPAGEATPSGFTNAGDLSKATVYFDLAGVEHVVCNAFSLNGPTWQIYGPNGQGLQPVLAVFTKVAGAWAYDPKLSITADALYASNPTLATSSGALSVKTNGNGETYYTANGISEISALPNNQIACVQYFAECVFVVDMVAGLVAAFTLPTFTDETGGSTAVTFHLAGRSVTADPTSGGTDLRFVAMFDLYQNQTNPLGVAEMTSTGGAITVKTTAPHGYGAGQRVYFTEITDATYAALQGTDFVLVPPYYPILAVTSTTFTIVDTAIANGSSSANLGTVHLIQAQPCVEMTYNPAPPALVPKTQLFLTGPSGGVGTVMFDPEGSLIVRAGDDRHFFGLAPMCVFVKTAGNRSYVTNYPYNAGTFATDSREIAMRDFANAAIAVAAGVNDSQITDSNGVMWVQTNLGIQRAMVDYPVALPLSNLAGVEPVGSLIFNTFLSSGANSTDYEYDSTESIKVGYSQLGGTWPSFASPVVSVDELIAVSVGDVYAVDAWALIPDTYFPGGVNAGGWVQIGLTFYDIYGYNYIAIYGQPFWVPQSTTVWTPVWADIEVPTTNVLGVTFTPAAAARVFQPVNLPINSGTSTSNHAYFGLPNFAQSPITLDSTVQEGNLNAYPGSGDGGLPCLSKGNVCLPYMNLGRTTLAGGNGASLPQPNLFIASAAGLPQSGEVLVITDLTSALVSYTGISGNTLTGCTGGAGALTTGTRVYGSYPQFLLQANAKYYDGGL